MKLNFKLPGEKHRDSELYKAVWRAATFPNFGDISQKALSENR